MGPCSHLGRGARWAGSVEAAGSPQAAPLGGGSLGLGPSGGGSPRGVRGVPSGWAPLPSHARGTWVLGVPGFSGVPGFYLHLLGHEV